LKCKLKYIAANVFFLLVWYFCNYLTLFHLYFKSHPSIFRHFFMVCDNTSQLVKFKLIPKSLINQHCITLLHFYPSYNVFWAHFFGYGAHFSLGIFNSILITQFLNFSRKYYSDFKESRKERL